MEPVTYVMKNEHDEVDKIFMENLEEIARKVYENFKTSILMIFDEDARKLHEGLITSVPAFYNIGTRQINRTKTNLNFGYLT